MMVSYAETSCGISLNFLYEHVSGFISSLSKQAKTAAEFFDI